MRPALLHAAAGAAAGCLATLLVVAVVWPDGSRDVVTTTVPTVEVPPPPPTPPMEIDGSGSESETEEPEPTESAEWDGGSPAEAEPIADAPPAGSGDLPDDSRVSCPTSTHSVSSADELAEALTSVGPGDTIELGDGHYEGEFVATVSGTEEAPIFLCGSPDAVLDGGDIEGGYTLHLDSAKHWRLVGFTVTGGQKGVMADGTVGSVIQDLTVTGIGDEAIHLRSFSTDNVVLTNTISDTGLRRDKYGEGVYIGSAVSNWCTYTECQPDRSDRNVVKGNMITDVTSEAVDAKEGTTGGVVVDNVFDGSAVTGADSWVDIKGNNYLVAGNTGTEAPEDGFQTHQILDGWGDHNVFSRNVATVNGPGHAFAVWPPESNVVTCDNTFTAAGEGLSNIDCT